MMVALFLGFSDTPALSRATSRGVEHRADDPIDVSRVHPGECVAQVDENSLGQAGRDPQYSPLASLQGSPPLSRAAIAVSQSIAAIVVEPVPRWA
jgi:hypothetical protein